MNNHHSYFFIAECDILIFFICVITEKIGSARLLPKWPVCGAGEDKLILERTAYIPIMLQ